MKQVITRIDCSQQLGLPVAYLDKLARMASFLYRTYHIPKKGGGKRVIHHPTAELKLIQRWISDRVCNIFTVHDSVYSYRVGRSIADHARVHQGAGFLLRIDLKNFFPSISRNDLVEFFRRAELDEVSSDWIASICSYRGGLAIGAPSSPSLSNAICYKIDSRLYSVCRKNGILYTRYADDLYFSTSNKGILGSIERDVSIILRDSKLPSRLRVNRAKTIHSSRRGRMMVTGIVLKPDGISVGRKRKRHAREMVYAWDNLEPHERASLAGLLGFIRDIEPQYIDRMYIMYGFEKMDKAMRYSRVE